MLDDEDWSLADPDDHSLSDWSPDFIEVGTSGSLTSSPDGASDSITTSSHGSPSSTTSPEHIEARSVVATAGAGDGGGYFSILRQLYQIVIQLLRRKDKEDSETQMLGSRLREKRSKRKSNVSSSTTAMVELYDPVADEELERIEEEKRIVAERMRRLGRNRSLVRLIATNLPIGASLEALKERRRKLMGKTVTFMKENMEQVRHNFAYARHAMIPSLENLREMYMEQPDEEGFDLQSETDETEASSRVDWHEWQSEASSQVGEWKEWESETQSEKDIEESTDILDAPSDDSGIRCSEWLNKDVDDDLESVKSAEEDHKANEMNAMKDQLAQMTEMLARVLSQQQQAPPLPPPQPTFIPPPPPPPPPPRQSILNQAPTVNKTKVSTAQEQPQQVSSMSDVLKGLSSATLKKSSIERSPGGTPMKRNAPPVDRANAADVIRMAMNERFKNQHTESPENTANDTSEWSTPSPKKPRARKSLSPKLHLSPAPRPKPRPKPRSRKSLTMPSVPESIAGPSSQ